MMQTSGKIKNEIMANTVVNPGSRLAGILVDLLNKLRSGAITDDQLVLFLKKKNPFEKKLKKGQELFNVAENFMTCPGLWVNPNFISYVAAPLGTVLRRPLSDLKDPIILSEEMWDIKICQELLGGKDQATQNAVCPSQVWQLIELQKGGGVGKMLNNGHANIFYVIGKDRFLFTVYVRWSPGGHKWNVDCREFDGYDAWFKDRQVFSN